MNKQVTINTIYNLCWEELMKVKHDENQIYANTKVKSLDFIDESAEPVSMQTAKYVLYQWVHGSFDTHGQVILYICRDNYLISIEDPTDPDIDYDDFETVLPGIFFIAND